MKKSYITITALICITTLVSIALLKGIDGVLAATAIASIAGLGGYTFAKRK